jgi:hypothetical protein
VTLLLAALLFLEPQDLERTSSFRFQSFDAGLPRSGQWRHGFAVADMNGDGLPDLAFTSPRKQSGPPVIFLNQRHGQWARWQATQFPAMPFDYGAVAAADFDGNGANDLAIASHYRGVMVVLGDGRGTFVASPEGLTFATSPRATAPFSSRAIIATDWNADGRIDVAALSDGPRPGDPTVQLGVTVYENLGSAWKATRATTGDAVFGDAIAAGDVDGDALPDLVTASHDSRDQRVLRLGSDGALASRAVELMLPSWTVRAADLHDFNGDGREEIVIGYSATEPRQAVIELVSFPAGSAPPWRLWTDPTTEVAGIATGDINGDGAADIVAALQDGRLLTFRGDGRGFVTRDVEIAPPEWRRGCAAYAVRLADLDGDARDEVIASFAGEGSGCASGGGVEVWRTTQTAKRRAVGR